MRLWADVAGVDGGLLMGAASRCHGANPMAWGTRIGRLDMASVEGGVGTTVAGVCGGVKAGRKESPWRSWGEALAVEPSAAAATAARRRDWGSARAVRNREA